MKNTYIPPEVSGQNSETINAIIKCLKMLWFCKSTTLLIHPTSRGTSIEVMKTPSVASVITPEEFGIKAINANVVSIYGGTYTYCFTDYNATDTDFAITSDCIIGTEYSIPNKTFSIVNFGSTFVSDADHIRRKLWYLKFTPPVTEDGTGTVSVSKKCNHMVYPANWGGN